MEHKADCSWQPCGNYRHLNAVTAPDTNPTPNMMDFTAKADDCPIFSREDLKKRYHQIPMIPADIPKTVITTLFVLFEFNPMTFSMRNASNPFQSLMDHILFELSFTFPYLDDILICSKDKKDHCSTMPPGHRPGSKHRQI